MRGLKCLNLDWFLLKCVSHPTRMRGLKFFFVRKRHVIKVASHADAWIEIHRSVRIMFWIAVASHADAWIEICSWLLYHRLFVVASHADAWIEIIKKSLLDELKKSHPTRMRGLKLVLVYITESSSPVASHADAWIEIPGNGRDPITSPVASHADAWIEIAISTTNAFANGVASHADAWIEIHIYHHMLPYENVASHADAWIEIFYGKESFLNFSSHPTRMRGLKLS